MAQSRQYKVSELAKRGLAKIVTYIAVENPNFARKVKTEIIAAVRTLERFPERCSFLKASLCPTTNIIN